MTSGYLPVGDPPAKCIVWGGDVAAPPALFPSATFYLPTLDTIMANVYVVQDADSLSLVCVATNVRKVVTSAIIHLNAEIAGGDVSADSLATTCLVNGVESDDPETAVKAMFRGSPGASATLALDESLGSVVVTFLKTV